MMKIYDNYFKRLFDFSMAIIGLIIVSPILLFFALIIKLEDGGAVFYRGVRVGLYGKLFRIFKFRTMVINADKIGGSSTSEDDPRITRIGRFLRRYKIDELPQLINVLIGDMSFVGPRPQVKWAVDLYTEKEKVILNLRPGLTDQASILFSNEGEILKGSMNPDKDYLKKIHPIKTNLAIEYANNHSLFLDIKIIFKTISKIIKKGG